MQRLKIPGLLFATSSVPLEFDTDGHNTTLRAADPPHGLENILALTSLHAEIFRLREYPAIRLADQIESPSLRFPEVYDGTQSLRGRNALFLTLCGWGDMIMIQPALAALCRKDNGAGEPAKITIGCNWIRNFPYRDARFIRDVRPNIMNLAELFRFDLLINMIPAHYLRSRDRSMLDLYLQLLGLDRQAALQYPPRLRPDPARVERLRPLFNGIRSETDRKILVVNWRSRFTHKNAPAALFFEIASLLRNEFASVLVKDEAEAKIMQGEIDGAGADILNLSHRIRDLHDTIAALSLADALISVDTGIVHAAGALGIPGVALFGPFPPETHVSIYPSIRGVRAGYEGRACRGPCLETHRGCAENDFSQSAASPCFGRIRADEVIGALFEARGGGLSCAS